MYKMLCEKFIYFCHIMEQYGIFNEGNENLEQKT